jgi:phosphoketolase
MERDSIRHTQNGCGGGQTRELSQVSRHARATTTIQSSRFCLAVNNRPKHLPAEQSEQDKLNDAATGKLRRVISSAHAAKVNTEPDQDTDDPDNPKE